MKEKHRFVYINDIEETKEIPLTEIGGLAGLVVSSPCQLIDNKAIFALGVFISIYSGIKIAGAIKNSLKKRRERIEEIYHTGNILYKDRDGPCPHYHIWSWLLNTPPLRKKHKDLAKTLKTYYCERIKRGKTLTLEEMTEYKSL